jgi:hypothetical protein
MNIVKPGWTFGSQYGAGPQGDGFQRECGVVDLAKLGWPQPVYLSS